MDDYLNGVFYCRGAFGRRMPVNPRGGRTINIVSISGVVVAKPQPQSHCDTSKAGVHMLTKSLAAHWAAKGVRVNAIAPAYIESAVTKKGIANSAQYDTLMEMTPTHLIGKPPEVALLVLFLASDLSSMMQMMQGSMLVADNGYT